MLTELRKGNKTVGIKQSRKAVNEGKVRRVYIALNADTMLCDPIETLCKDAGVAVCHVQSMEQLGNACGINVGTAVAALLK